MSSAENGMLSLNDLAFPQGFLFTRSCYIEKVTFIKQCDPYTLRAKHNLQGGYV